MTTETAAGCAAARPSGRPREARDASVLRPFDELRVAPSGVEGRQAQHALSSSKGGGGAPRALRKDRWTLLVSLLAGAPAGSAVGAAAGAGGGQGAEGARPRQPGAARRPRLAAQRRVPGARAARGVR